MTLVSPAFSSLAPPVSADAEGEGYRCLGDRGGCLVCRPVSSRQVLNDEGADRMTICARRRRLGGGVVARDEQELRSRHGVEERLELRVGELRLDEHDGCELLAGCRTQP